LRAPAPLDPNALTGEIDDGEPADGRAALIAERPRAPAPGREGSPGTATDPVTRLRTLMAEKRDETAEILRSWMEEGETEDAR
jgi:flagellar M-ring protein FliF